MNKLDSGDGGLTTSSKKCRTSDEGQEDRIGNRGKMARMGKDSREFDS
jgi:hypothetical protein